MERIEDDASDVYIRCRGNVLTEPLPSNDRELLDLGVHRHTDSRVIKVKKGKAILVKLSK
jgi:hypothetical protein